VRHIAAVLDKFEKPGDTKHASVCRVRSASPWITLSGAARARATRPQRFGSRLPHRP
jgi:hypothetical protein